MRDVLICDYVVTSANVEDLAFVDRLLVENQTWTIIIADANAQPGGHWCNAAPFAKLDQPSSLYGVGSRPLDTPHAVRRDEILQYCHSVVQHFVQRGRVRYFPLTTFDGKHLCSIVDSDLIQLVTVRRKVVRSSFRPQALAVRTFPFHVAAGTAIVPPKDLLPSVVASHAKYVVIGAGRSGMETVIWLLKQHGVVCAERVRWVVPRDAWLVSHASMEPGRYPETARRFWGLFAGSATLEDFECGLEEAGLRHRVDPLRRPAAFTGATVTEQELAELRRAAPHAIRKGRVREVHVDRLVLERGSVPTGAGTLHIDCTSDDDCCLLNDEEEPEPPDDDDKGGEDDRPPPPVAVEEIFQQGQITLQLVQEIADNGPVPSCFSAALIGHVECIYPTARATKNAICTPMAPPRRVVDALVNELASMQAESLTAHPKIGSFIMVCRPGRLAALGSRALRQLLKDRADKDERKQVISNLARLTATKSADSSMQSFGQSFWEGQAADMSRQMSAQSTASSSAHFDFEELERLEELARN